VLKTWPAAAITDDMVDSLRTLGNLAFEADRARTKMNWLDIASEWKLLYTVWESFFKGTLSFYPGGHNMNITLLCSSRKYLYPPKEAHWKF